MIGMELNYWYKAEELQRFIAESEEAQKKRKRFCYKSLMGFLLNRGKDICALYGIRRTGKTVLMLQAMKDLLDTYHIPAEKIAYITIAEKNTLNDEKLVKTIDELSGQGVRYVFVDEISYIQMELEDNSLNLLADRMAKAGMKIVIAGAFSYAIRLLTQETLFDRVHQIDTTYFSYKEAREVFDQDLDTFIKYGGVINFDEDGKKMTPADYMETAVVQNIVQSIFRSDKKYELLMTLPEELKTGKTDKELKAVIARLIRMTLDRYMKLMVFGGLADKKIYRFSDVGNLADVIRQRSEKEHLEDIPEETFRMIVKIFEEIGIKQEIYLEEGAVSVFIPNYLRYGLCDRIMRTIGERVREETNRRYDAALAGENLMGVIQEAICYLDLKKSNQWDFDMYRSADGSCEIDLILRDKKVGWMDLYEIKHSSQIAGEQVKHLVNREFIREVEQELKCKVRNYYVLYNGPDTSAIYRPEEVFAELEQRAITLQKENVAKRWERLAGSARVQAWEPVEISYRNMERFLCELEIVR